MKIKNSHLIIVISLLLVTGCGSTKSNVNESDDISRNSNSLTVVKDKSRVSHTDIYTFNCELIEQKPDELTPNCADFGEAVFNIKWNMWNSNGADGIGIYSINDCNPNCADGTRHDGKAKVRLDNLYTDGTKYFLTEFTYELEKSVVPGGALNGGWFTTDFSLQ